MVILWSSYRFHKANILYVCMYECVCVCVCVCIYIYIYSYFSVRKFLTEVTYENVTILGGRSAWGRSD